MRSLAFNFITLHYAWVVFMGLLSLPILLPYGNLAAIDAYFFGASASTMSGLNTHDCKDLALYQQLYIYFVPLLTNLGFVNIMVVVVRLYWFNKRIDKLGHALIRARRRLAPDASPALDALGLAPESGATRSASASTHQDNESPLQRSPLQRSEPSVSQDWVHEEKTTLARLSGRRKTTTLGRDADVDTLTSKDRDEIGGVEYRSLKLLLKVVTVYFFGIHLLGGFGLLGWIQYADAKYTNNLREIGQDQKWWAFYTAQSMMDNLGFSLTPDSMAPFRDAVWPLLLMSFLGLAGETLYPVFLRFILWTLSRLAPRGSPMRESCRFLLKHPRRCYTLLFPSGTTWALLSIISALNAFDTLLIVVLDRHNPQVAGLDVGKRIAAALFQAVASRHAGMTPYTLADVHPAVQVSLLVMMYISAYPVALSVWTSNAYEERPVGLYAAEARYDENKGLSYLVRHMQQQLSFDLWYIFIGIFLLAVSESSKIQDSNEPSFEIFPIFFEVVSAYANVGISLGHASTTASLSARFSVVGKLVICAMMIRGRHRALPSKLDRAVMLPDEHLLEGPEEEASRPMMDRTSWP
ncbi:hypothetical protein G6O67_005077 [Ophiocordyceps sinensis]|uniref:Potassium transport protein, high-affinity n=1 Tax=Ophiocordyceps sinensis TaxID=72228 RepID=A0A8H4PQP9_9HYPO|nr:hypothetical protein G6O67_005077 [Ophiocordyceps sinensis]